MDRTVKSATRIDGVVITELRQITDARGALLHMIRADSAEFEGFGECYFSEVQPGAVKAWKRHRVQIQNFAVPSGRIRLVVFDDREGASTKGQLMALELGRPDRYHRVRIPAGVWYGFTAISAGPALLVNCPDIPHDPHEGKSIPHDDPTIPYRW